MRRNKHHVGRLRMRAADILAASLPYLDVRPDDIVPASGSYRTCRYHDVCRWELFTRHKTTGIPAVLMCWETLTNFIRIAGKHGCHESNGFIYCGPAPRE